MVGDVVRESLFCPMVKDMRGVYGMISHMGMVHGITVLVNAGTEESRLLVKNTVWVSGPI